LVSPDTTSGLVVPVAVPSIPAFNDLHVATNPVPDAAGCSVGACLVRADPLTSPLNATEIDASPAVTESNVGAAGGTTTAGASIRPIELFP